MSVKPPKTDLIRRHLEFLRFYPRSVEGHYNLGLAYLEAGEMEDALSAFRLAVELRPSLVEGHINMGGIFFRQGRLEECIRANETAAELAPDSIQAHSNLAFALLTKGDWKRAVDVCRRALELNPSSAIAHHHLAMALGNLGEGEEALRQLDEAARLGFQVDPALREEIEASSKQKDPNQRAGRKTNKKPSAKKG